MDPGAILHITQSRVPTADLAATADALRSAAAAQPPGVFVDFRPDDRRAGRPAVTYREVRPGHDIRWTVVVAGRVRISIGCQSTPDNVVRTGRSFRPGNQLTAKGTKSARGQSNQITTKEGKDDHIAGQTHHRLRAHA